jgi:hypothetical protein
MTKAELISTEAREAKITIGTTTFLGSPFR